MNRLQDSLQDRRWLGLVAVVAVLCTSSTLAAIAFKTGLLPVQPVEGPETSPTDRETSSPPNAALTTPSPSVGPQASPTGLPFEVQLEMGELEKQVSQLRGLVQLESLDMQVVASSELAGIVQEEFLSQYGQADAESDLALYTLLDLVDGEVDFRQTYLDLYSSAQITGYYDNSHKSMVLVHGTGFGGPERLTYVHEFDQALLDQHFPFERTLGYSQEACRSSPGACAAVQALLEGDATLLEEQWLRTFASDADIDQLNSYFDDFSSPAFNASPAFVQDLFLFPYTFGREFVAWYFREGGWAAIDGIYRDPPTSTEQIMHPERYPDDKPVAVAAPDLSEMTPDWMVLDQGEFGEYELSLIFEAHLDETTARDAASGWAGSSYTLLQRGDQSLFVYVGQWDTIRDAQQAWLALRDYGEDRLSGREARDDHEVWESDGLFMLLEHVSDQVLWILAPDEDSASEARDAIGFPVDAQ